MQSAWKWPWKDLSWERDMLHHLFISCKIMSFISTAELLTMDNIRWLTHYANCIKEYLLDFFEITEQGICIKYSVFA